MSTGIIRKFFESASEVLDVVGMQGGGEATHAFMLASLAIIVLTSFTSSWCVVFLTFIASTTLLLATNNLRKHLRRAASALVYVLAFSLVALSRILFEGSASLYLLYVLRATSAASFLLAMTAVLGWRGLADFLSKLRLGGIALTLVVCVGLIPTLLRDASRALLGREARILRRPGLKDLPAYAAVVGDLLVRGSERGGRTLLALNARTLTAAYGASSQGGRWGITKLDVLALLIALTEALVHVAGDVTPW
ncbi:MAG: hypothetical protein QW116_02935 [Zestosphaera sp.]